MIADDLEARVAALPCWRGRVRLEPLPGGLSNRAFVVDDGVGRYVARCGNDLTVHHVFRDRERAASEAAYAAGLAPAVIHAAPGVLVLRYRSPNLHRPFRTPLVPLVPILSILICGYMMSGLPGDTWLRLLIWLALAWRRPA